LVLRIAALAKRRALAMRVAVIGGLERHEAAIGRRAGELGHTVEFHRGWVGGRRAEELEAIVSRSEIVIIVTQVNSHGAMYMAKRVADRHARRALVARRCTPSSFGDLLESVAGAPNATQGGAGSEPS
jgi:hypothetical protein